ncbi:MAG: metal-dependent hydrolase [Planctomycetaceae bacterium]|jgi:membrane-bound metal-dependent hydrolase YbcI (DUF457 family)|nr:metal-dependent hydrolase [Planctomycetaceae bacterium]
MGSFKQHIACSTATGIILGAGAYHLGFSVPTSLLSAGLCSIAGMLPDIDSDTSRSFQECIYFAAGLSAVLLVQRLREFSGIAEDIVLLSGACNFLFVRFAVGFAVKKLTNHRGMFHSIPAAVFSGQLVFFLSTGTVSERLVKAAALTIGYLSHLILDEICSIDSTGRTLRLKKSFGTALKLYDSHRLLPTAALYSLIVFLGFTAIKDPEIIKQWEGYKQQYAERQIQGEEPKTFLEKIAAVSVPLGEKTNAWLNEQKALLKKEATEFLKQGTEKRETGNSLLETSIGKIGSEFVFTRRDNAEAGNDVPGSLTDSTDSFETDLLPQIPRRFSLMSREPAPITLPAE